MERDIHKKYLVQARRLNQRYNSLNSKTIKVKSKFIFYFLIVIFNFSLLTFNFSSAVENNLSNTRANKSITKLPILIYDSGLEFQARVASGSVEGAFKELNIVLNEEDIIIPNADSMLRPSGNIFISRAVPVSLAVDDKIININTHTKTVKELIESQVVELRELDKITPSPDSLIISGLSVEVIRVVKEKISQEVDIAVKTITQKDPELSFGKTKIVRVGEPGKVKENWEVTYENGKEIKRKLLSKETTKEMVARIVAEGAKVELGQPSFGKASWYRRTGMTAASLQYKFGAKVLVTNIATGASVTVTINDRGPYIGGRIIDLSDKAFSQLARLGQGVIDVKVEEIL